MINISHRGNLNGPNPELENSPAYILNAMYHYEVEVDAWWVDSFEQQKYELDRWGWYLGHDKPQYWVPIEFLQMPKLWVHLKNLAGVRCIVGKSTNGIQNYFWHQTDDCTITSTGFLWTSKYTGWSNGHIAKAILMKADLLPTDMPKLVDRCYFDGLCSDYIGSNTSRISLSW